MKLFKRSKNLRKESIAAGSYIFHEGDHGEHAYRILSGEVGILMGNDLKEISLARLKRGDVFGEMGMVGRSPRSASAKALTAVTVEVMTEEEFNETLLRNTDALLPYLTSIFDRTRRLNQQLQTLQLKGASYRKEKAKELLHEKTDLKSVVLIADSAELKKQGSLVRREIDEFPFYIGRRREAAAVDVFQKNQLAIFDERPYNVSRNHCAVEVHDGSVYVRDRGSHSGTIVNGLRINGSGTSVDRVKLEQTENILILGGAESSIRFKLVIE